MGNLKIVAGSTVNYKSFAAVPLLFSIYSLPFALYKSHWFFLLTALFLAVGIYILIHAKKTYLVQYDPGEKIIFVSGNKSTAAISIQEISNIREGFVLKHRINYTLTFLQDTALGNRIHFSIKRNETQSMKNYKILRYDILKQRKERIAS